MATSKFHLAPHGPAVCRVDWTNPRTTGCPFGGDSGQEEHFSTMAEAEAAYEHKMEQGGNGLVAQPLSAPARPLTLQVELNVVRRRKFDVLIADSSYGISKDPKGNFFADGSECLGRLRSDFVKSCDSEPEILYADDTEDEVISSIYIPELKISVENQNLEEDIRELQEYRQMRSDERVEYWR